MNGQYFGERVDDLEILERKEQNPNSPVVNSDYYTYKAPVDPYLTPNLPVTERIVDDTPLTGSLVDETQVTGSGVDVTPVAEAVTDFDPLTENVADFAPVDDEVVVETAPLSETVITAAPTAKVEPQTALLDREVSEKYRTRWSEIQGQFVDEPRSAVQQADALVSDVIGKITEVFANEHSSLEGQWKQGNDASTEDLRKALQHYRSFFNRLVV